MMRRSSICIPTEGRADQGRRHGGGVDGSMVHISLSWLIRSRQMKYVERIDSVPGECTAEPTGTPL